MLYLYFWFAFNKISNATFDYKIFKNMEGAGAIQGNSP